MIADKVRVRATPETEGRGVAGLVGVVYGETRPSVTGATVIGAVASDYAVNIHFEGQKETLWFPPELLEFADQAPEAAPHLVAAPKRDEAMVQALKTSSNHRRQRTPRIGPACILRWWRGAAIAERYTW